MLKSSAPAAVVEQDPLEYYDQLTAQIEVRLLVLKIHKYSNISKHPLCDSYCVQISTNPTVSLSTLAPCELAVKGHVSLCLSVDRSRGPQHGADRVSCSSHLWVSDRGVKGPSVQHHRAGRAGFKGHTLLWTNLLPARGDGVAEEAEEWAHTHTHTLLRYFTKVFPFSATIFFYYFIDPGRTSEAHEVIKTSCNINLMNISTHQWLKSSNIIYIILQWAILHTEEFHFWYFKCILRLILVYFYWCQSICTLCVLQVCRCCTGSPGGCLCGEPSPSTSPSSSTSSSPSSTPTTLDKVLP